MKILSVFLLMLFVVASESELDKVRNVFPNIVSFEQAQNFYEELNKNDSPEAKAYAGTMLFMKSKYASFPTTKFKHFKNGKKLLQEAFLEDNENIEVRYLRFFMQSKTPKFLKYNQNIVEDYEYIITHIEKSTIDKNIKTKILSNMLLLDELNPSEKIKINDLISKIK